LVNQIIEIGIKKAFLKSLNLAVVRGWRGWWTESSFL